jgi:hypothetical protein
MEKKTCISWQFSSNPKSINYLGGRKNFIEQTKLAFLQTHFCFIGCKK